MRVTINLFDLAPYQRAFLYNPHRFTGVEASTKAGKTAAGIQWAVEQWHRLDCPVGWETTWCSPVYEQSKIAFKRIKRALPKAYDVNSSTMTMYTPRGDELRFKSADNVDNLYGPDARAVIFEEYTRAKNLLDAFMALRSTLSSTRGKMKMIGNYIGASNAGHQLMLAHKSDPEWAHFIVPATMAVEAGILDGAEVDQASRDLPPWKFMALYMCQGSDHPLQMMNAGAIGDLWTNRAEDGSRCMVVDPAGDGQDLALIVVYDGLQIIDIYTEERSNGPDFIQKVDAMAQKWSIGRSKIIVDADGLGGMGVADHLPGCYRFHGGGAIIPQKGDKKLNFANLRTQCYYLLADYVNDSAMGINEEFAHLASDIGIELEYVRRKDDVAAGKLGVISKKEVKEALGRSPGYADTMMMRMVFELKPQLVGSDYLRRKGRRFHREDVKEAFKEHFSKYRRPS